MTTLVLGLVDRIKKTRIVKESLEVISIASETYQLYKKDMILAKSEQVPIRKAEDLYFEAATKVTHQKPKQIHTRLDYRTIAFSAENFRKAKNISTLSFNELTERLSNFVDSGMISFKQFLEIIEVKYDSLKSKYAYSINRSKAILKNLGTEMNFFRSFLLDTLSQMLVNFFDKLSLGQAYESVCLVAKTSFNFFNLYAHSVQSYTKGVLNDIGEYLLSFTILKSAKAYLTNEIDNIRTSWIYFSKVLNKNEVSLLLLKDYVFDKLVTSFDSNRKLIAIIFRENWKIIKSFFENLDFEVFYSPDDSVKLVKDTRLLMSILTEDKSEAPSQEQPKQKQIVVEESLTEKEIIEEVLMEHQKSGKQHAKHHLNKHPNHA
jgi:hypothetical protein